jgi:hypothetical protein
MRAVVCAVLLVLMAAPGWAKVSPEEAARLLQPDGDLTPMGGEKAGNKDGTIPPWEGRHPVPPAEWPGLPARLIDPFPDDKPLFVITAANMEQHRDKLTVGQMAMLQQYSGTYKIPVYKTRRTAGAPDFVYEATYRNATTAELGGGGEALVNAITGIPFPIPQNGHEAIWNHKTRFRGFGGRRWNVQAPVPQNGNYTLSKLREDFRILYSTPGIQPEDLNNVIIYFLQVVTDPPRLAGTITLVHETMDQIREPRRAWQFNPGLRRLRRAPNVGYDNPGTGSDGLRTNDQTDTFNGAMDRYTWRIVGKREVYIPYNGYRLNSSQLKYKDILLPGHINQDHARYELHRVWVVEAELKSGTSHIYKRRTFHVDEDSWQIVLVDIYDKRDQLWRVQEAHTMAGYGTSAFGWQVSGLIVPAIETVFDLQNGRYLAQAMSNEEPEPGFERQWPEEYFAPANVSRHATR